MKKLICAECGQAVANTSNVLSRHLRRVHDIEWPDYVVKTEMGGIWPTCACGCGKKLTWKKGGFRKYVKGHDGLTPMPLIVRDGWVSNPFTGREERFTDDDEIALLKFCISINDPITHDHGIRVGWQGSDGKMKFITPGFKHLRLRLLLLVDELGDVDKSRKIAGLKEWCRINDYSFLLLRRNNDSFDVVGGFKPTEKS